MATLAQAKTIETLVARGWRAVACSPNPDGPTWLQAPDLTTHRLNADGSTTPQPIPFNALALNGGPRRLFPDGLRASKPKRTARSS